MNDGAPIRLGTCSWSTKDWVGKVYEAGTPQTDFIRQYSKQFSTVEIDSTFYGTPAIKTIEGWRDRTPDGFIFSAKAPQVITHEKFMRNCERDLEAFIEAMAVLGDRLGPIVFQFPYFAKKKGVTQDDFLERLKPFLKLLPTAEHPFVVEVRNKPWLNEKLLEPLRTHDVTLALIDHPWMPRPDQFADVNALLTGRFAYIRWLGDRYGIEKITKRWNKQVVDRDQDLARWMPVVKQIQDQQLSVFGYVNNHYSGHAPDDVTTIRNLLGQ
jgi:uncharacterized protein YecE (DUF72 family)